jgi:hypothetical protein
LSYLLIATHEKNGIIIYILYIYIFIIFIYIHIYISLASIILHTPWLLKNIPRAGRLGGAAEFFLDLPRQLLEGFTGVLDSGTRKMAEDMRNQQLWM